MAKTLTVYTLYADVECTKKIIDRLVAHDIAFSYTGEFIYGNSPWEDFIEAYCQDIKDRITTETEHWSDSCLNYDYEESYAEVEIEQDGEAYCCVSVKPSHLKKFQDLFGKICRLAAMRGVNVQFYTRR